MVVMTLRKLSGRRLGRRGVAGFFEEIPVLILVTIGVGMFMVSMIWAISTHNSRYVDIENTHEIHDIMKTIRTWDGLCYQEEGNANRVEGLFDCHKVMYLSATNLSRGVPELAGGSASNPPSPASRTYRLRIEDTSAYPFKYSADVNNIIDPTKINDPKVVRETAISSVNIKVNDEEIHVAKLELVIFRLGGAGI